MPRGTPIPIPPPLGGRPYGVPPQFVRDDQLSDAENVYIEKGALQDRRGFDEYSSNVLGVMDDIDALVPAYALESGGGETAQAILTSEATLWGLIFGSGQTPFDISSGTIGSATGTILTSLGLNALTGTRWWFFPVSGDQSVFVVDGNINSRVHYFPSSGNPSTQNLVQVAASPQGGRDIISAAARLIVGKVTVATGSTEIHVSNVNDATTWPSGHVTTLDDTPDPFVGFGRAGRSSFYVLKRESQWLAQSTPNAAFPFRFDEVGFFPGPQSPRSVVQAGEASYWLGRDGSFYRLLRGNIDEVGQQIKKFLETDVVFEGSPQVSGAYVPTTKQIWWFYPSQSAETTVASRLGAKGIVVLDLETQTFWKQAINADQGSTTSSVLTALGWPAQDHVNNYLGLLVGVKGASGKFHILRDGGPYGSSSATGFDVSRGDGGGEEAGEATTKTIAAMFQTAVRAPAGANRKTTIRAYMPMFRKESSASNTVTVTFLGGDYPDTLSTLDTWTITTAELTSADRPFKDRLALSANWIAIKHEWDVETDHSRIWDGGMLWVDAIDEGQR